MKRDTAAVLAVLGLTVLARAQYAMGTYIIHQDGPVYVQRAMRVQQMGITGAWDSIEGRRLPIILFSLAGDTPYEVERWALIVAIGLGSLAVLPLMAVAGLAFGRAAAFGAGILYAMLRVFLNVQSEIMTEGVAHFFLLSGMAAIAMYVRDRRYAWLVGGVVVIGLAALSREDGYMLGGLAIVTLAVLPWLDRAGRGRRLAGLALFAGIAAAPVVVGGLTSGMGMGEVARRIYEAFAKYVTVEPSAHPGESFGGYAATAGPFLGSIVYVLRKYADGLWYVVLLGALFGVWASRGRRRVAWGLLAAAVLVLVPMWRYVYLSGTRIQDRMFSLSYFLLLPLAAHGINEALRRLGRPAVAGAAWILLALALASPTILPRRYDHSMERVAWEWLGTLEPVPRAVYGGTWTRMLHYAGTEPLPECRHPHRNIVEERARNGTLEGILLWEREGEDQWMRDLVGIATQTGEWEVRRFPPEDRAGIDTAVLYIRRDGR